APLLAFLRRSGGIELSETQASGVRPQGHQVLVAASDRTPGQADVEALEAHLRAGGGVVLLGGTLGAWSRNAALAQLAGWRPGHLAPPAGAPLRPRRWRSPTGPPRSRDSDPGPDFSRRHGAGRRRGAADGALALR